MATRPGLGDAENEFLTWLDQLRAHGERLAATFGRVTSSTAYIPEIDGLRFLAIGSVLAHHLRARIISDPPHIPFDVAPDQNPFVGLFFHGHFGVQFFFVISGFILAVPFAEHHLRDKAAPRLKSYFLRRLTRLEPPYFLVLFLCFLIRVLGGVNGSTAAELLPHLGTSLLYVHNLVYRYANPLNIVTWSLEVEVQFYLLVPLLSHLFRIRRAGLRRATILGLAGGFAVFQAIYLNPDIFIQNATILAAIQYFLIGFVLADIYLCDWPAGGPSKHWFYDVLWVAGWTGLVVLWTAETPVYKASRLVLPFALLGLYVCAFRGPWTNKIITSRLITTIGGMCYSIYLLHLLIFKAGHALTKGINFNNDSTMYFMIQLLVLGSAAVVCSALFFVAIEKPCMRRDWPQRAAQRLRLGVRRVALALPRGRSSDAPPGHVRE